MASYLLLRVKPILQNTAYIAYWQTIGCIRDCDTPVQNIGENRLKQIS